MTKNATEGYKQVRIHTPLVDAARQLCRGGEYEALARISAPELVNVALHALGELLRRAQDGHDCNELAEELRAACRHEGLMHRDVRIALLADKYPKSAAYHLGQSLGVRGTPELLALFMEGGAIQFEESDGSGPDG